MQRMPILSALLGLVYVGAAPASAKQTEVTLFGRKYAVTRESRAQTYKNGRSVVIPPAESGTRMANLWFTQGADPSQDRLFVVCPIASQDSVTGHQFYLLTGADVNGVFRSTAAGLTEFFGGNANHAQGGRPVTVIHLNDEQTGAKVDRNLLLFTFSGDDQDRYYDLDSLSTDFISAAVASQVVSAPNPLAFRSFAPGPGGNVVSFGEPPGLTGVLIGVMDPKTGKHFPVRANLAVASRSAANRFVANQISHASFLYSGDPAQGTGEYWILTSSPAPEGDSVQRNQIWRLRLRFPADLTTTAGGSLQVEVLGPPQELKGTPLHASDGGVYGMAVGREVAPGLRRLYFADWQGNLYTATPLP